MEPLTNKAYRRMRMWDAIKRPVALGTAGLMVMSGLAFAPAPAFAADPSLTVNSHLNGTALDASQAYNAYQLFTGTVDDTTNAISDLAFSPSLTDKKTELITFLDGKGYEAWLTSLGFKDAALTTAKEDPANAFEFISAKIGEDSKQATDWDGKSDPANADYPGLASGSFGVALADWAKANLTAAPVSMWAKSDSGYTLTAPEGYYLILTQDGNGWEASAPIFVPVGGNVSTVNEKVAQPTISKEVQEDSETSNANKGWGAAADAELGQEVPYRIVVNVPSIASYNHYRASVADHLSAGQQLVAGQVTIMAYPGTTEESAIRTGTATGGIDVKQYFVESGKDYRTLTAAAATTGTTDITWANSDLKAITDTTAGANLLKAGNFKLVIEYKVKLTEEALGAGSVTYGGNGNENTADFTYTNNPTWNGEGEEPVTDTPDVSANVAVYTTSIDKFKENGTTALPGAKFAVKNAEGKYLTKVAAADNSTTGDKWSWEDALSESAKFTTDTNGQITGLKGLDEGVYTLIETDAPTGYARLSSPITLTVTSEETVVNGKTVKQLVVSTTTVTDNVNASLGSVTPSTGDVNVDVKNSPSVPLTGAEGVGLGGAAVLAIGLGWYLVRRRKLQAEDASAQVAE